MTTWRRYDVMTTDMRRLDVRYDVVMTDDLTIAIVVPWRQRHSRQGRAFYDVMMTCLRHRYYESVRPTADTVARFRVFEEQEKARKEERKAEKG